MQWLRNVIQRREAKQQSHHDTYATLTRKGATEGKLTPKEEAALSEAIEALGLTPADIEKDAAAVVDVQKYEAQLAAVPGKITRRDEMRAERERLVREFEAIKADYAAKFTAINEPLRMLEAEVSDSLGLEGTMARLKSDHPRIFPADAAAS